MTKTLGIKPAGWRMLIKPVEVSEKSKGGIILTEQVKDITMLTSVVGQVVAKGGECYNDKSKFTHTWAEVGDWVMIGKYGGSKFNYQGDEYRLINDDEVLAIVDDPKSFSPF